MDAHYLSLRAKWQDRANSGGSSLRDTFAGVAQEYLESRYPGEFQVTVEPKDLRQIYFEMDYAVNPEAYARPAAPTAGDVWFDAEKGVFMTLKGGKETMAGGGGCIPDVKIKARTSGHVYFVECKQQNDAGNAHERCAKYATASILGHIKRKLGVDYHPIGYAFSGALVDKRKYVVELQATFAFAKDHLFLWKKERPVDALIAWLDRVIVPLLLV